MRFLLPLAAVIYVLLGGRLADTSEIQIEDNAIVSADENDGGMIIEDDLDITLGENEIG